uniref:Uncharacterized protein n=1 Tax=Meloidogyne enterolobii TaxID=390850 RepID=A0A6V7UTI0_MELEN|nr:unnamed protein product [Meloidogyne enterolobii]
MRHWRLFIYFIILNIYFICVENTTKAKPSKESKTWFNWLGFKNKSKNEELTSLTTNHREKRGAIMEGISGGLLISAGLFFAYLAIFSFLATFTPINIFAFATGMFFSMLTWFCIQAAIPLLEGSDNGFDSNIASYSREESYYEGSDSQGGYQKHHNIREYTRAVTK